MRTPDSVESSLKVIVFDWNLGSLPNVLGMTDIALSLLMNRRTLRRWFPSMLAAISASRVTAGS